MVSSTRDSGALFAAIRAGMLSAALLVITFGTVASHAAEEVELLESHSRAPYVHRITLYDHDGEAIDPTDEPAVPYSPYNTCAKCHPVGAIRHGWHFNSGDDGVWNGRPGEPWIIADDQSGTQIPISARDWPGALSLSEVGLTNWEFIKRFGRHIPGGGLADPDQAARDDSPEMFRWMISGSLEIDCMFCHDAGGQHDPAEAERQIEKENFKWAPTAALGLAVVRGDAKNMPDDWDPLMGVNPDRPDQAPPTVLYDAARFDGDDRLLFKVTRRPPPTKCYFCHSTREVRRADDGADWHYRSFEESATDVHMAAGLTCSDCHRNGMDHATVRGFEGEASSHPNPAAAAFTCVGCHYGVAGATDEFSRRGGHYGAPRPEHRGFPPIHFEKLSCTACHSGPYPGPDTMRAQTAMAHALGTASRERHADTPPAIVQPVYVGGEHEQIRPYRMLWPRYFGSVDGDKITPLPIERVRAALEKVASAPTARATASEAASAEDRGATPEAEISNLKSETSDSRVPRDATSAFGAAFPAVFETLQASAKDREQIVAVLDGLLYDTPGRPGKEDARAKPYMWSLAHDVRPASQASGARGCEDCHAAGDVPLFFGQVERAAAAGGPFEMIKFQGDEGGFLRVFGLSFVIRPAFKVFGWLCVAILLGVLITGFQSLVSGERGTGFTRPMPLSPVERRVHLLAVAGVVVQALTGIIGVVVGHIGEWLLMIHMAGAGLFLLGLTLSALLWAGRLRAGGDGYTQAQQVMFWCALAIGCLSAATMLGAMLPLAGTGLQITLLLLHRFSGLTFVAIMIAHTIVSWGVRSARERTRHDPA